MDRLNRWRWAGNWGQFGFGVARQHIRILQNDSHAEYTNRGKSALLTFAVFTKSSSPCGLITLKETLNQSPQMRAPGATARVRGCAGCEGLIQRFLNPAVSRICTWHLGFDKSFSGPGRRVGLKGVWCRNECQSQGKTPFRSRVFSFSRREAKVLAAFNRTRCPTPSRAPAP